MLTHAYRVGALPGERALVFALLRHRSFCLLFCFID